LTHGEPAVNEQAGTVIFIAPEVLRNKYTLSADLWSVGIIAYLLLTGRLPFAGEEGEEVSDLFIRKQTFQNRVRH
jgi:calcium-dependent protein kinase